MTGRFHIERCKVLKEARDTAKAYNARLVSVSGISVRPEVFKKGRRPSPKPAKIAGFVMSHTVSKNNPRMALTEEEIENGLPHGKKGHVRCLVCNMEVFAPNTRFHSSTCQKKNV